MRLRELRRGLAVALVLALGLAGSTRATTLGDLISLGGSVASGSGRLWFDGFQATITGELASYLDTGDIEVLPRDDGIRLVGSISVADGNTGDITLEYDLWATSGFFVDGASMWFNGVAIGSGSQASTTEDFFTDGTGSPLLDENGDPAGLVVAVTGGGLIRKRDTTGFAPIAHLHVLKDISVTTFSAGDLATISVIHQDFSVIPEPTTLLLLSAGLAGLGALGRRRSS